MVRSKGGAAKKRAMQVAAETGAVKKQKKERWENADDGDDDDDGGGGGQTKDDGLDCKRVYISRLPNHWGDDDIKAAMSQFGSVKSAQVCRDRARDESRGFGFVVFDAELGKKAALAAAYIRGQACGDSTPGAHKTKFAVKITDVNREDADSGVCRLWSRFLCPHGEACKFAHPEGLGGPRPESTKVRKCLEFRKKGRCTRGDACEFAHVAKPTDGAVVEHLGPKPCFNWKRKGKCRKGSACPFAH